ncbi:hypothetical protein SUDANB105_07462 [Streptomyces sp. enrichment culture]|uniref:hypothetical protein n=1 Tax=Streptomyces sp. enrichment culture TaxID=1795815 RepID=UPI003F54AA62
MRRAFRTIPPPVAAAGHRLATTLTLLLAVLLAALPADAVHTAAAPVPNPAAVVTGAERPDTGPRAEDTCAAGCTAQARTRHDHLGERPNLPDHHATDPRDSAAAAGAGTSAPSAHSPVSPGRSAHDRGRAPPAPAGT